MATIVVDVQMYLGDGGGGAGHEQGDHHRPRRRRRSSVTPVQSDEGLVREPHDARCMAMECVCVVESMVKLDRLWLFVVVCASVSV